MQTTTLAGRSHAMCSVAHQLHRSALPFCLFEGAAGGVYGYRRVDRDAEFLVGRARPDTLARLFPGGQITADAVVLPGATLHCSPLSLRGGGREYAFAVDAAMIAKRVGRSVAAVPLMSPEDQLVLKATLQRRDGERDDLSDLSALLASWGHRLDFEYVEWRARRSGAFDRVQSGLKRAGWRPTTASGLHARGGVG